MITKDKRIRVAEAATRLARLLDANEQGLATWHIMCEQAYQDLIAEAVKPDEPAVVLS
jgi:hypothetical protein